MVNGTDMDFVDLAAARGTIAGVLQYGLDSYIDVGDLLEVDVFRGSELHQSLWSCIEDIYKDGTDRKIDIPTLLATSKRIGVHGIVDKAENRKHIRSLLNYPIAQETVRHEAARLFRRHLAYRADGVLAEQRRALRRLDGSETIAKLLGHVEDPIFDFSASINSGRGDGPQQIAEGIDQWLDNLENNPRDNIGIPTPFPIYNAAIGGGFRRATVSIIGARPKTGKEQPLDSLVFTPSGPIRMGDIAVGDAVSTPYGGVAKVVSIHPQGEKDIYRVVFADGDSAECGIEHLWRVKHRRKKNYQVMSLKDIVLAGVMDGDHRKWQVQLPTECYYTFEDVPIDPYLLGTIIGNGGLTTSVVTFTSMDDETLERMYEVLPDGHSLEHRANPDSPYDYVLKGDGRVNLVRRQLQSLGLVGCSSHDKFIPDIYKYNSAEVRWDLIQGLCDTDGSAYKAGNQIEYSTASKRLAYDIKELVQSLGGLCHVKYRKTACQTGTFWSYRLYIKHNNRPDFFRLSRKKDRMTPRKKPSLHRTIRHIEYVGKKPAQCIMLDSDDHLYMTNHHIVTHNTVCSDNIGLHVAGKLGIKVLNLDTEMTQEEHHARILAHLTGIDIKEIESGRFAKDKKKKQAVRDAAAWLKTIPYYYESVVDKSFDEQVAIMRRWVTRNVPVNDDGIRDDCLIIYDYLQLTDPGEFGKGDFKEYQILGFQMLQLLRMAARCDVAVLSLLQLNRDGVDKESTAVAAGSDRIIWKAASFTILKKKDEQEIAEDGSENGNLKLVPVIARHGEALSLGDYISVKFTGRTAKMEEGKTRYQIRDLKGVTLQHGFEVDGENENIPFDG